MDNRIFDEKFWYGASCAPYAKSMDWPMEQWDGDLANMKKMDFSVARIFVPWDRIERKEGMLDFGKQDHFMDLAAKHGIGVILNVGGVFDNLQGVYAPSWLERQHKVSPHQDDPRLPVAFSGLRPRICLDDPVYREKAFAFVAKAARRYSAHPATVGWMIWNEPWLPNCYCPATVVRFRGWLETRYHGDLDELNRLWGTEFPVDYSSWSEVQPPRGAGFLEGGLNAWRDWREFDEFRMGDAMLETNRVVKANDPAGHPTTANICFAHALWGGGAKLRMSVVRDSMDVMGFSYYTLAHGEGSWLTPFRKSLHVASFRWFSKEPLRRTLVLETEAGPNCAMITEAQRRLNNWLAVGHNAKSIVCWNYRSRFSDNQVGEFNMMAWDGSPTRRAEHHASMARTLNRHAKLLNRCVPGREAAVLMPDSLAMLSMVTHGGANNGQTRGDCPRLEPSRHGAFKLLWDMNIPFDGINECNLSELGQYKLVLLPGIENMSPEIAAVLKDYVAQGGMLVAESPFAFKDENNFLHGHAPLHGLAEVFGAFTRDREGWETASAVTYADGSQAKVCFLWHAYEPTTAEVMASYADGRAALVSNRFGQGRAVVFGTEVFRQYFEKPEAATVAALRRLALESGARRTAEVLVGGQVAEGSGIEVCRIAGEPGVVYIILNHCDVPAAFRLRLRDQGDGWFDLESDAQIGIDRELTLPPLGALVLARPVKP